MTEVGLKNGSSPESSGGNNSGQQQDGKNATRSGKGKGGKPKSWKDTSAGEKKGKPKGKGRK